MEKSIETNKILEDAIKTVCNNQRVYDADHIQAATEIGKNLFTIVGKNEVIPIIDQGIVTKFWTLPDFVKDFSKKLPEVVKSKKDEQMKQLQQYAKSGNTGAYRELRKQMKE